MKQAKKKLLHNISGLTLPQYLELKDLIAKGSSIWRWAGYSRLKPVVSSCLYHRECYRKTLSLVKLVHTLNLCRLPQEDYDRIANLRAMLEGSTLYKLRDTPVGHPKVWRKNKANFMRIFDRIVCDFVRSVYASDDRMLKLVENNEERWSKKRLPGSGSMKRGRPRKRKRDRSREKRPYDTLLVRIDGIVTMPLSRRDLKSYAHRKVEILKDPREANR